MKFIKVGETWIDREKIVFFEKSMMARAIYFSFDGANSACNVYFNSVEERDFQFSILPSKVMEQ